MFICDNNNASLYCHSCVLLMFANKLLLSNYVKIFTSYTMGFYEIPVDIRVIFWYFFSEYRKKYQKITRISPVFLKNTWYNCIILQLFDFQSS